MSRLPAPDKAVKYAGGGCESNMRLTRFSVLRALYFTGARIRGGPHDTSRCHVTLVSCVTRLGRPGTPPLTCDDKDPSLTHCVHSCMATLAACSTAMRSANAIGRPSLQTSWPPPPLPRPPLYLRANQHKPRHLHRLGERQLQQAALGLIVLHHPVAPVDVHLLEELAIDDECLAGRQRAHLCSAQ